MHDCCMATFDLLHETVYGLRSRCIFCIIDQTTSKGMPNYDIYIFTFYDIGLIDTFNENSSIRSDALNKSIHNMGK